MRRLGPGEAIEISRIVKYVLTKSDAEQALTQLGNPKVSSD